MSCILSDNPGLKKILVNRQPSSGLGRVRITAIKLGITNCDEVTHEYRGLATCVQCYRQVIAETNQ
jgi:hypothetical protein